MHPSFVDRDMVMRYYLGLGMGHTHQHGGVHGFASGMAQNSQEHDVEWEEVEEEDGIPTEGGSYSGDNVSETDEDFSGEDDDDEEDYSDDEEVLVREEMYGFQTEI